MLDMADQDAVDRGAYTQSDLNGDERWVVLPQIKWPKEWRVVYKRLVCRLSKASPNRTSVSFGSIATELVLAYGARLVMGWSCLYNHKRQGLFLPVSVDDFGSVGWKAYAGRIAHMFWTSFHPHTCTVLCIFVCNRTVCRHNLIWILQIVKFTCRRPRSLMDLRRV